MKRNYLLANYLVSFVITYTLFSFQEKTITWVAMGDSITYLNDHQNAALNTKVIVWLISIIPVN